MRSPEGVIPLSRAKYPAVPVLDRDAVICAAFALVAVLLIGLAIVPDVIGGRAGEVGWIGAGVTAGEPGLEPLMFAP
jgi:hypothetical protein